MSFRHRTGEARFLDDPESYDSPVNSRLHPSGKKMNKKSPKFNSHESSSRTRVLRPQIKEYVKPLIEDPLDKMADAIRKSWIRERSHDLSCNGPLGGYTDAPLR